MDAPQTSMEPNCVKVVLAGPTYPGHPWEGPARISAWAQEKAEVIYVQGQPAEAPRWLQDAGHGLLAFNSLEAAKAFDPPRKRGWHREIWEAHGEGPMPLPPFMTGCFLAEGRLVPSPNRFPKGTVAYRQITLLGARETSEGGVMRAIYKPKGRAGEYAPYALNLYLQCTHGCLYCYVPIMTHTPREEFCADARPRRGIINQVELDAQALVKRGEKGPVLLSFLSDPYQPAEDKEMLTRLALEVLKRQGLQVSILSKAGLRACRDLALLDKDDWFGTTLTLPDARCREWEPYAALTSERIEALKRAKAKGLRTWVSFEPVLDPQATLDLIRRTAKFVDKAWVGKLHYFPILEGQIDWHRFAHDARDLLESLSKNCLFKKDLAAYL